MTAGEHILAECYRMKREMRRLRKWLVVLVVIMSAMFLIILVLSRRVATASIKRSSAPESTAVPPAANRRAPATTHKAAGARLCIATNCGAPAKESRATSRDAITSVSDGPPPQGGDSRKAIHPSAPADKSARPLPLPRCGMASTARGKTGVAVRAAPADIYQQAANYIHYRESRYGKDPKCKRGIIGPAGERGEYQITPIFIDDCLRLFMVRLDPFDGGQCRRIIPRWLKHYRPKATSIEELYKIYRFGSTGARR